MEALIKLSSIIKWDKKNQPRLESVAGSKNLGLRRANRHYLAINNVGNALINPIKCANGRSFDLDI